MMIPDKRGEKYTAVEPDDTAAATLKQPRFDELNEVPAAATAPASTRRRSRTWPRARGRTSPRWACSSSRTSMMSVPGSPTVAKALAKLETLVVVDTMLSETAMMADYVLPGHDLPRAVRPEQPLGHLAGARAPPAGGEAALRPARRVRDRRGARPAARPQGQGRQGLLPSGRSRASRSRPDGLVRGLALERAQERRAGADAGRAEGAAGRGLGGQGAPGTRSSPRSCKPEQLKTAVYDGDAQGRGHGDLRQAEGPEGDADRDRDRRQGGEGVRHAERQGRVLRQVARGEEGRDRQAREPAPGLRAPGLAADRRVSRSTSSTGRRPTTPTAGRRTTPGSSTSSRTTR